MKKNLSETFARGTVSILNLFLRADANSTSCVITYQPKVPKKLENFKKK